MRKSSVGGRIKDRKRSQRKPGALQSPMNQNKGGELTQRKEKSLCVSCRGEEPGQEQTRREVRKGKTNPSSSKTTESSNEDGNCEIGVVLNQGGMVRAIYGEGIQKKPSGRVGGGVGTGRAAAGGVWGVAR